VRIILDQDDVLFDFMGAFLAAWNRRKGTNWTADQVSAWDIEKSLGPGALEFMVACYNRPGFYSNLVPLPGAVEGVRTLISEGHDVVIASAVPVDSYYAFDGKKESLTLHMPWFDQKNFFAIGRKDLLDGDILLDDASHNLVAWANKKPGAAAFDRYWNRTLPATEHAIGRAYGWADFCRLIRELDRAAKVPMEPAEVKLWARVAARAAHLTGPDAYARARS
jgi:5'-nucleotidase